MNEAQVYLGSDGCASRDVDHDLGDWLIVGVDASIADEIVGGHVGDGLE